jgi:hypothetical protein
MSWHWIIDDPRLTANEKLVALTIARHQFYGKPVVISHARIASRAAVCISTVQRAIRSMESKGYRISLNEPGRTRCRVYQVRQEQGILFSNANFHAGKPVQKSEEKRREKISTVATSGCGTGSSVTKRAVGPTVSGSTSEEAKPNTRANGTRDTRNPSFQEKTNRLQARERRVHAEIETIREANAGSGPGREDDLQRAIQKIARLRESLMPVSREELERRRDDQKARLAKVLKMRAGGSPC